MPRTSSTSIDSERLVKPTRSQNSTDTTLRSSRTSAAGASASGAPHARQKRAMSGLSWPQAAQMLIPRLYETSGVCARTGPFPGAADTTAATASPVATRRPSTTTARRRRRVYDRAVSDAVSPVVVSTPEGEIHGWRHGHGERTAVLLHGGPGLSDMFETLTPLLADLFTCVRYQQRGLAPTTIREPYTVDANVADAAAVIDAEAGGRAWMIGFSWGGHLALHVLVAHPERVAGAIILDPLGAHIEVLEEFEAAFLPRVPADRRQRFLELGVVSDAGQASPEQARESWELTWPCYFADYLTAPPAPVVSMNDAVLRRHHGLDPRARRAGDADNGLPLVDPGIPVLFVHGRQSPMPVRASADSAALIPHARLEVLDGAGHFVWLEQPQLTVDAITSVVRTPVG